jgi:hypothetical protein
MFASAARPLELPRASEEAARRIAGTGNDVYPGAEADRCSVIRVHATRLDQIDDEFEDL